MANAIANVCSTMQKQHWLRCRQQLGPPVEQDLKIASKTRYCLAPNSISIAAVCALSSKQPLKQTAAASNGRIGTSTSRKSEFASTATTRWGARAPTPVLAIGSQEASTGTGEFQTFSNSSSLYLSTSVHTSSCLPNCLSSM
jgi:hypothetical protein